MYGTLPPKSKIPQNCYASLLFVTVLVLKFGCILELPGELILMHGSDPKESDSVGVVDTGTLKAFPGRPWPASSVG